MVMQTDVKCAHINETGILDLGRTRFKGFLYAGNAAQAGVINVFDTITVPTAYTYARSGTTITVSHTAHGYAVGKQVALAFSTASAVSATNGTYTIATVATDTYTVTDINTGSVAAGTVVWESADGRWLLSLDTLTGATASQQMQFPGEGLLAYTGLTATMTNITFVNAFYG